MGDWAIVVGVNKYWSGLHLKLAVNDALAFTQWLVDKNGGRIQNRKRVFLLISDTESNKHTKIQVPKGVNVSDATFDSLQRAILTLSKNSGARGDRLFFYFAGHGFVLGSAENSTTGLLLTDFDRDWPNKGMTFESIKAYFRTTSFKEQFFFIDACRSSVATEFLKGTIVEFGTYPRRLKDPIPSPVQYEFYATAPDSQATESLDSENSPFTEILLKGLRGDKGAKSYQPKHEKYVVTANNLFQYLIKEVQKKQLLVNVGDRTGIQSPRSHTNNLGVQTGVLSTIPIASVEDVELCISVEPAEVRNKAAVLLRGSNSMYDRETDPVRESPIILQPPVLPMDYSIEAFASGHSARFDPERSDAQSGRYEPEEIKIHFDVNPTETRSSPPWRHVRNDWPPGTLTVRSEDPLAPVEVRRNGSLVAFGQGKLKFSAKEQGRYSVGLSLPHDRSTEELIELAETDQTLLVKGGLPKESDLFNDLVAKSNLTLFENTNTLALPSSGIIAAGGSSTLMMLTHQKLAGSKWSNGLASEEEINSERVCVIIADELLPSDQLADRIASLDVRLRHQQGEQHSVRLEGKPLASRVSRFAGPAEDGNYILSITPADGDVVNMSVSILPGQTSLTILHSVAESDYSRVFGFSPAIEGFGVDAAHPNFLELRRMELLQRHYLAEEVDATQALKYARGIQRDNDVFDPLAASLAGYTLVTLNRAAKLGGIPERLISEFPDLPDGFVLLAEQFAAEKRGKDGIIEQYIQALDRGIPVFAKGIRRIASAADEPKFEHSRLEQILHIVAKLRHNSAWTYWRDQKVI